MKTMNVFSLLVSFLFAGCVSISTSDRTPIDLVSTPTPKKVYYDGKVILGDIGLSKTDEYDLNASTSLGFLSNFKGSNLELTDEATGQEEYKFRCLVKVSLTGYRNITKEFPIGPYQLWGLLSYATFTLIPFRSESSFEVEIAATNTRTKTSKTYKEKLDSITWAQLFLLPYTLFKYNEMFLTDDQIVSFVTKKVINEITSDINSGKL